jgi:hypothetical protein
MIRALGEENDDEEEFLRGAYLISSALLTRIRIFVREYAFHNELAWSELLESGNCESMYPGLGDVILRTPGVACLSSLTLSVRLKRLVFSVVVLTTRSDVEYLIEGGYGSA